MQTEGISPKTLLSILLSKILANNLDSLDNIAGKVEELRRQGYLHNYKIVVEPSGNRKRPFKITLDAERVRKDKTDGGNHQEPNQ